MNAAIAEIIRGKTVLVIVHRLQTIVNADKICVMKDGNIIAADTHENCCKTVMNTKSYGTAVRQERIGKSGMR